MKDLKLPGLEGQRIAVTAGASGIGFAIAHALFQQGARVAICDIDETALTTAQAALGDCPAIVADVSDPASVDGFFDQIEAAFGGLDGLMNNAGIAGPTAAVDEIAVEDWKRCIDICLTGQFLCARRATAMLKAAGGGSIVSMSSSAGKHGYAYRSPYSAAKFGVIGFTQSLAKELGPHNIRVNAILPGFVAGPRMEGVIRDRAEATGTDYATMEDEYLSKTSMRKMVTVEDVAHTVAFLMSDAGANLSGQSLAVDANVEVL